MLKSGIYEKVLNNLISKDIDSTLQVVKTEPIDYEEAAKILADYLAQVLKQGLTMIKDNGGKTNKLVVG